MTSIKKITREELYKLFPGEVPLSALMILASEEISTPTKNEIIRQLSREVTQPVGTRKALRGAQEAGNNARHEAFDEAQEILRTQLLWANSTWMCSKGRMALRIGRNLTAAQRRSYEM